MPALRKVFSIGVFVAAAAIALIWSDLAESYSRYLGSAFPAASVAESKRLGVFLYNLTVAQDKASRYSFSGWAERRVYGKRTSPLWVSKEMPPEVVVCLRIYFKDGRPFDEIPAPEIRYKRVGDDIPFSSKSGTIYGIYINDPPEIIEIYFPSDGSVSRVTLTHLP